MRLSIHNVLCACAILVLAQPAIGHPEDEDDTDCMRGHPQPVVEASAPGVREHSYTDLPNREAIERVILRDGLVLQIRHEGCSHFMLTYEFLSSEPMGRDGLARLEEVIALLERLAQAAPDNRASGFLDTLRQAKSDLNRKDHTFIWEQMNFSRFEIYEALDEEGRRWVRLHYDIAL